MHFKPKRDRLYRVLLLVIILITVAPLAISFSAPGEEQSLLGNLIILAVIIAIEALLIWTVFGIRYVFCEEYLYLQGGPFRSKIQYAEIVKVKPLSGSFFALSGYRLLNSRKNAIELVYRGGTFGSVKIAPADLDGFLEELQKRGPRINVECSGEE